MLSLAAFALTLVAGVPVAFALLAAALVAILVSGNTALLLSVPQQVFAGIESYGLLALPVYLLLGEMMNASGAARRLMTLAALCVESVRGGLMQVTLLANAMLAAVLGSTVAQITLMSRLAVPDLERAGYPRDVAVAGVAAGGLLAPVVPPSMLLIVFGVIAQVPVGDLFVAGIGPGLALAAAFAVATALLARRRGPAGADAPDQGARPVATVLGALPALAIPVVTILSILSGLATAVEAGIFGIVAVIVVGMAIYRELRLADLWPALMRTAETSAMVLFLVAAAGLFGWVAAWENLPARLAEVMTGLTGDAIPFLMILTLLLIALGTVLDPMPALILVVPVFLPVATETYGIDPLHFGIVVCLTLTLGLLTPPVGTGLFAAASLNGIAPERLARALVPYFAATCLVLAALIVLPGLATGLVRILD